jgi:hypothetical protein
MPRDAAHAGFNASSNASSNSYSRSSQITPNSAECPVRIDDTCFHTVDFFPTLEGKVDRGIRDQVRSIRVESNETSSSV